jgi:hypothetical protein
MKAIKLATSQKHSWRSIAITLIAGVGMEQPRKSALRSSVSLSADASSLTPFQKSPISLDRMFSALRRAGSSYSFMDRRCLNSHLAPLGER